MLRNIHRRFCAGKAITINAEQDSDAFFDELEQSIKKSKYIIVEGCMKDYGHEQILMRFIDKYKMFVDYFYTSMENVYGRTYIVLKTIVGSGAVGTYADLATAYTKDYYMNDCGGYDVFRESKGNKLDQRLQDVYNLVNPKETDKILDIGCGRGELSHALSKSGAEVTGVDYSEAAIAIARKTFANVDNKLQYVCEDIFKLDNMGSYNKFVMADVVEHIDQEILEKIFEKIADRMSERGVLVIHTAPNSDYYKYTYPVMREEAARRGFYLQKNPRSYYEQLMHINEQSPKALETALKKYFKYVHVWTGSVIEIKAQKKIEETYEDNQIFAYACKNEQSLLNLVEEIEKKPVYENCSVVISAQDYECLKEEKSIELEINVRNVGSEHLTSRRKWPIYISYHIYDEEGSLLNYDGERTCIDRIIRCGESAAIKMKINLPDNSYTYEKLKICITMVAEGAFWFDQEGENCTYIYIKNKMQES